MRTQRQSESTAGRQPAALPTLPAHPLANLLPPMSGADFAALLADIDANGHRNMTTGQRVWAAVECYPHFAAQARARKRANGGSKKDQTAFWAFVESFFGAKSGAKEDPKTFPAPGGTNSLSDHEIISKTCKCDARDAAGKVFGVSGRYVSDGLKLKAESKSAFAMLQDGRTTLAQAKRAVPCKATRKRRVKKAALANLAQSRSEAA